MGSYTDTTGQTWSTVPGTWDIMLDLECIDGDSARSIWADIPAEKVDEVTNAIEAIIGPPHTLS